MIDIQGAISVFIDITDGKVHDVNVLDILIPRLGRISCRFSSQSMLIAIVRASDKRWDSIGSASMMRSSRRPDSLEC